jgi:uncharacterized membrane protein
MNMAGAVPGFPERFLWIIAYLIGIAMILPLLLGALSGMSPGVTAGFLLLVFALQAIAAPLGLILGFSPLQVLAIMACFGFGVILAVFEICRTLAESSQRVGSFIAAIERQTASHPLLRNYGAISCFFIVWIPGIGIYGTPIIAWLFCWRQTPSILFTLAGFLSGCVFFMYAVGGLSGAF